MSHYQTKLKIGVGASLMGGPDALEEHTRMAVGFCILVRVYYCETGELGSLSSSMWISKRDVHKGEKNL